MALEKVISITGKPGLFELVTQTRGGFIAKSLLDSKKVAVNAQTNVSLLSEIAIYTLAEEVPLREVFVKIKEKEEGKETSISHKDSKDKLEAYFFEVLPDFDEDRVYTSDIKKVIQWYNILVKNNLLELLEESKVEEASSEEN